MKEIRLWAPAAKSVEIDESGHRRHAKRGEGGWWVCDIPDDAEYLFVIDGGPPTPDPRSQWQPYGVHGRSRTVDHSRFTWTDGHWRAPPLGSAIIYELHIGTFTPEGTFISAISRLDHLVWLGITHVELMPVNEFAGGRGWGYDGVDLYAPYHGYGTPDDLKRLVNACHAKGLAVLLDVVYNHLGPTGNYLNRFGPYFTKRYATPWGPAMNLDAAGSAEVRAFIRDNALMWLRDYHFDGLRLDAIHELIDISAVPILEHLATSVELLGTALGKHFVLIGESDLNNPVVVRSREAGGWGLDAQWSDDFHHALHSLLTGERSGYYADFGSLADLAKAFNKGFVYDGRYSAYRQREHGREPAGLSGHHFLAYAQNHDQIGNRAKGERSAQLMSMGRLKVAAALVMVSPYVPMLFQGEEWGASTPFQYFTGHEEPDLARKVSEGRVREFVAFGWDPDEVPDPQSPETFERSRIDWNELSREPHTDILDWHRKLIGLRRSMPSLLDGRKNSVRTSFDEERGWLVVERDSISLTCNLGTAPLEVECRGRVLLASEATTTQTGCRVRIPPDSAVIQTTDRAS